jgi:hypothetical protein
LFTVGHLFGPVLLDAGTVHPGIHVQEQTNRAALPDFRCLCGVHERRNAHRGKLPRDFADAQGVGALQGIRDQNVAGARAAGGQQFERRRALEVRHAVCGEHAHDEFEFGGLHMRPPAVGIAAEQSQRRADIRFY